MREAFHLARLTRLARRVAVLAGMFALPLLAGCGGAPMITSCEAAHGITPDCRFQNPEDLVASPQGQFILVSQMGDMEGHAPGSLVALAPATGEIQTLFPAMDRVRPAEGWGAAACPPPAAFSPHGIDLEQLESGAHALYVINHGGRESVEMFEVIEDEQGIGLIWRGCVLAPDHGYFNDLVVLRNGDFWVSQMFPRDANMIWSALRMQFTGFAPGYAYHWSPAGGFARLPGTDAKFANGIEKSADERYVFLNSYFGDELIKVETVTGTRLGSVAVASPDNLSWSPAGDLLVASHHASIPEMLACTDVEEGNCGFRFQIVAVNPETLAARVLLDHAGPPMGAATVALPFEDSVYLGTFAGDRIARVSSSILAR